MDEAILLIQLMCMDGLVLVAIYLCCEKLTGTRDTYQRTLSMTITE